MTLDLQCLDTLARSLRMKRNGIQLRVGRIQSTLVASDGEEHFIRTGSIILYEYAVPLCHGDVVDKRKG